MSCCEIAHSVLLPCGQSCVYVLVVFSVIKPIESSVVVKPARHWGHCDVRVSEMKQSAVELGALAAGIKACVVCQSFFLKRMQVINSYLRLHIAAIMLTALPNHKTHTQRKNTQISKPTRLLTSCRPAHFICDTHSSQTLAVSEISTLCVVHCIYPLTASDQLTTIPLYCPTIQCVVIYSRKGRRR